MEKTIPCLLHCKVCCTLFPIIILIYCGSSRKLALNKIRFDLCRSSYDYNLSSRKGTVEGQFTPSKRRTRFFIRRAFLRIFAGFLLKSKTLLQKLYQIFWSEKPLAHSSLCPSLRHSLNQYHKEAKFAEPICRLSQKNFGLFVWLLRRKYRLNGSIFTQLHRSGLNFEFEILFESI